MLSVQKQPKYVTKTLQLPNGQWATVLFELVEQQGKIIAKAISAELIEQSIASVEVVALPTFSVKQTIEVIVSPFFSSIESVLKDLSFVISQPTRAPASF